MRLMRAFHRWFGLVSAILMTGIGITGTALQLDLFWTGDQPPQAHAEAPVAAVSLPDNDAIGKMASEAVALVRAEQPKLAISMVQIDFAPDGAKVKVGGSGRMSPSTTVDMATHKILPPPPPRKQGYHGILQDIHAGYFMGMTGRIISIVMGLALALLGVTGLIVYIDMFKRRKAGGKTGLFWH